MYILEDINAFKINYSFKNMVDKDSEDITFPININVKRSFPEKVTPSYILYSLPRIGEYKTPFVVMGDGSVLETDFRPNMHNFDNATAEMVAKQNNGFFFPKCEEETGVSGEFRYSDLVEAMKILCPTELRATSNPFSDLEAELPFLEKVNVSSGALRGAISQEALTTKDLFGLFGVYLSLDFARDFADTNFKFVQRGLNMETIRHSDILNSDRTIVDVFNEKYRPEGFEIYERGRLKGDWSLSYSLPQDFYGGDHRDLRVEENRKRLEKLKPTLDMLKTLQAVYSQLDNFLGDIESRGKARQAERRNKLREELNAFIKLY